MVHRWLHIWTNFGRYHGNVAVARGHQMYQIGSPIVEPRSHVCHTEFPLPVDRYLASGGFRRIDPRNFKIATILQIAKFRLVRMRMDTSSKFEENVVVFWGYIFPFAYNTHRKLNLSTVPSLLWWLLGNRCPWQPFPVVVLYHAHAEFPLPVDRCADRSQI